MSIDRIHQYICIPITFKRLIYNPIKFFYICYPTMEIEPNQNIYGHKNFKINIQKLEQQFQCTVCLNPINDCYVTRCGHVYCRGCIEETINRHHRCPFCNQQLKQFKEDVFKNYHFNTIRKIVEQQKLKESDKYLNKVFASDLLNKIEHEQKQMESLLKPIEQKIVGFCKSAILDYRKFMITLYDLEKQTEEKKALLGSDSLRDHQKIIQQLQSVVLNSIKNPIIAPEAMQLSTQIELVVPGNKTIKKNIKISPLARLQSLLPCLQAICSENNIRIPHKISEKLTINNLEVKVSQRLGLYAGGKIKVEKGIPFQSNVYCFTHNWFKEKVSNFFICQQCKVKWICENCALYCHQGHKVVAQLKEHNPDWAICYCVSKCKCKALNKNSVVQ